jgi:hypothetical protein
MVTQDRLPTRNDPFGLCGHHGNMSDGAFLDRSSNDWRGSPAKQIQWVHLDQSGFPDEPQSVVGKRCALPMLGGECECERQHATSSRESSRPAGWGNAGATPDPKSASSAQLSPTSSSGLDLHVRHSSTSSVDPSVALSRRPFDRPPRRAAAIAGAARTPPSGFLRPHLHTSRRATIHGSVRRTLSGR